MTETEHHDRGENSSSVSTEPVVISAEEKLIIDSFEEMFKDRYTESDEVFMKVMSIPLASPPLVQNWYSRPKRSYDWTKYIHFLAVFMSNQMHRYNNVI